MAISPKSREDLVHGLGATDWLTVRAAAVAATEWIKGSQHGTADVDEVVACLVELADHEKWEVRRQVAVAGSVATHAGLDEALAKLAADDHAMVRREATRALRIRRSWAAAEPLGAAHAKRIAQRLEEIEARFGEKGRIAVTRAAEEIASIFAREFYHEVVNRMATLASSAKRLRGLVVGEDIDRPALDAETERFAARLAQLKTVIRAMREYTSQPDLKIEQEPVKGLLAEAVGLVSDLDDLVDRSITIHGEDDGFTHVDRSRFLQALVNIIRNALESYDEMDGVARVVEVRGYSDPDEPGIVISVRDYGCGMEEDVLADCRKLFSTSKSYGTGFGLPLVVKIVEHEHRGRLSIESTPGAGTVVEIRLRSGWEAQ